MFQKQMKNSWSMYSDHLIRFSQLCTTQLQEQEQQLATPMTIPYVEEKDPILFSFK